LFVGGLLLSLNPPTHPTPPPPPPHPGRNIHALDPYRMPGIAAVERGAAAGEAILQQHRGANGGAFPETVAINLWWGGGGGGAWGGRGVRMGERLPFAGCAGGATGPESPWPCASRGGAGLPA
jgi:hypothetical protein